MKVKRVLHIINGMGTGGAEKDIMNWYRNIDRNALQFDFLIRSGETFYKDEIETKGGKLYQVAPFPAKFLKNYIETKKFIRNHASNYDAIHVHGNALTYIVPLMFAKKYKIPVRIMHIHNTKANGIRARRMHGINKRFIARYCTVMLACSKKAGMFGFGDRPFQVLNNAMDLKEIKSSRCAARNEFGISKNAFVVGHVGRFIPVKNHKFVVDIFKAVSERRKDSRLLLVGSGPMREEIQDYVHMQGLSEKVLFLGDRKDVESILKTVDCVVFPSLYEGIPLVVLESQACEKKVLCSDNVDSSVKITPYVQFLSLEKSEKEWADKLLEFHEKEISCDINAAFKEASYDMESVLFDLYKIYGLDN